MAIRRAAQAARKEMLDRNCLIETAKIPRDIEDSLRFEPFDHAAPRY